MVGGGGGGRKLASRGLRRRPRPKAYHPRDQNPKAYRPGSGPFGRRDVVPSTLLA